TAQTQNGNARAKAAGVFAFNGIMPAASCFRRFFTACSPDLTGGSRRHDPGRLEMKPIAIVSLLTAAVALSACMSDRSPRGLPVAQAPVPQGVEGSWVDPNGIVSSFTA